MEWLRFGARDQNPRYKYRNISHTVLSFVCEDFRCMYCQGQRLGIKIKLTFRPFCSSERQVLACSQHLIPIILLFEMLRHLLTFVFFLICPFIFVAICTDYFICSQNHGNMLKGKFCLFICEEETKTVNVDVIKGSHSNNDE